MGGSAIRKQSDANRRRSANLPSFHGGNLSDDEMPEPIEVAQAQKTLNALSTAEDRSVIVY